jgi:hypothetical protein
LKAVGYVRVGRAGPRGSPRCHHVRRAVGGTADDAWVRSLLPASGRGREGARPAELPCRFGLSVSSRAAWRPVASGGSEGPGHSIRLAGFQAGCGCRCPAAAPNAFDVSCLCFALATLSCAPLAPGAANFRPVVELSSPDYNSHSQQRDLFLSFHNSAREV